MIGKFKTPEALLHSYECLERAFTQKCQQIKRMEGQPMKVYELKIDWATNDAEDCTTTVYATEEKARIDYLAEIKQAKADYSQAFNEDGTLDTERFEIEESNNYWHLFEKGYWSTNHCLITLTEKEVL